MTKEATTAYEGLTYEARLEDDGTVEILRDNTWAGEGRWDGQRIIDCAAVLGGSQEAADEIYAALDAGLRADAMTTVTIDTRAVGSAFAVVGVVRDTRTGEELATTADVPQGMEHVAYQRALALAEERGWTVQDADEG